MCLPADKMEIDSVYQQKIPVDLTTATSVRIIAMYAEAQRYITGLFLFVCFFVCGEGVHLFIHLHFYMSLLVNAPGSMRKPLQSHCQALTLSILLR